VLARLEKDGLAPSPEASETTLLRRLSFDLTGLPPTPAEVSEFVNDKQPEAYERAVDRLLASPHYGEKWARHWLDLARYADSDGYEKDLVRPYAWRWRNWVINALNADMPFDQFTVEQLAGDLLAKATVEQRVATGFHRNVLTNREAGVDRAEARFEQDVNRTNTIATTWLGLTVGCAQCHNHKYDPISQKDYYRLFAFIRNVEEHELDAPLPGEIGPYLLDRPRYQKEREKLLTEYGIPEMQAAWEEKVRYHMAHAGTDSEWDFAVTEFRGRFDYADKLIHKPSDKRTVKEAERVTNYFVISAPKPDLLRDKIKAAGIREVRDKLNELIRSHTPLTEAMTVVESDTPVKPYLAVRGDFRVKGEEVEPGTLSVLPPLKANGTPTRLELARWLVAPENPLTARVAANRMWQEFFGRGIVRTSEDFGTQGEKPSHPELLDWLGTEFRDNGWSMKRMHRLIVTSAAYRQSSKARPELNDRDPENRLIARQARLRLPAELIRDEALAVSGLLNPAIGGESIRPPQPAGIAELGYSNSVKWNETKGPGRFRRGLYILFQRTAPYPMLMTFDEPDSNVACSRRARSNTPLQSLNLLNDPVFFEAAQAFALRAEKDCPAGAGDRIGCMFQLAIGRQPSDGERERLARYLDEQATIFGKDKQAAGQAAPLDPKDAPWVGLARVLLNLDEFITRE
jgi:hypothetical protein